MIDVCLLAVVVENFPVLRVDRNTSLVDSNFRSLSISTDSKYNSVKRIFIKCAIVVPIYSVSRFIYIYVRL